MRHVLVDTSVWVEHFRHRNPYLLSLLTHDRVMTHPFVIGEIACGTPPKRAQTLTDLALQREARQASVQEAMILIEREHLFGVGCGLIDILLLASTLITPGAELWTLDKRLGALAERLGVKHQPVLH